jgi:hypothetical protein
MSEAASVGNGVENPEFVPIDCHDAPLSVFTNTTLAADLLRLFSGGGFHIFVFG